jgi:hypothetical protein
LRPAAQIERRDPPPLDEIRSTFNTLSYRSWRHRDLTLEQLLALARDNARHGDDGTQYSWQRPEDDVPARATWAAREFEIRVLLRDGRIDETNARALRGASPLADLPHPLEFDEPAALTTARKKCPRRNTLPLERQLEMLREDHAHELQQRLSEMPSRQSEAGWSSLNTYCDKVYEVCVADLMKQIAERDRLSAVDELRHGVNGPRSEA